MAKHPALFTLRDQWAGFVLMGFGRLVTKQERGVTHNVLKTRPIRIEESNRN